MSQLSQLSHPQVAQLSKPEIVNNSERLLALLLSLREEVERGGLSPSELVSSLVKLIASNNAAVKGEVCHLLILAAANEPDLGLLVVNTLTKVKRFRTLSEAYLVYPSFLLHRLKKFEIFQKSR